MREESAPQREHWLDGLRGVAALAVAIFHYVSPEFPTLYRSFWRSPPEENRRFYQLLPFRAFISGPSMVRLFFVISGYSLAIGLPNARVYYNADEEKVRFYRKLSSAVFRRAIRLFIPIAMWSGVCHILFYAGAHPEFPDNTYCLEAKPFPSSPLPLISCYMGYLVDLGNFLDTDKIWNTGFNNTLWSLTFEFRGSLAVYILMLGTSNLRSRVKLAIIAMLAMIWWWSGTVEMPSFATGLLLAEMNKTVSGRHVDDGSMKSDLILPDNTANTSRRRRRISTASLKTLGSSLALFVGIYLLSMPGSEDGTIPADFNFFYGSPRWETVRFAFSYYHIGATLVLASLLGLSTLRRALETTFPKFLGKISFALFVVHHTIYNISKQFFLSSICWMLGAEYATGSEKIPHTLLLARILTGVIELGLSVLLAVKLTPLIDQLPRLWAIKIEKLFSVG